MSIIDRENTTDSEPKGSSKILNLFFIILWSIAILACLALFVRASLTHQPAFKLLESPFFTLTASELLGYNLLLLFLSAYCFLLISLNFTFLFQKKPNKFSLTAVSIGTFLWIADFVLLSINKIDGQWYLYYFVLITAIASTSLTFAEFFSKIKIKLSNF